MLQILLRICGNVQGVGFRAHVRQIARQIGLKGWVKNEQDGSVLAMAEGEEKQLEEFEKRIGKISHQFGPKVEKIEIENKKKIEKYSSADFLIAV